MYPIPPHLFKLYSHWKKHAHISRTIVPSSTSELNSDVLPRMQFLINGRMHIWHAKESGMAPPYTTDPVLSKFRFCNIYRELDRQTIEIHSRNKHLVGDFPLWLLNVAFARFVCRTSTVEQLGQLSFSPQSNKPIENSCRALMSPKFGNAYVFPVSILRTINCSDREAFFCGYLPELIPQVARLIATFNDDSVADVLPQVIKVFGANFKFHWTEILIDIAYQYPQYLNLYKKFPIGPGSRPTMKALDSHHSAEDTCLSLVNCNYQTDKLLHLNGQAILLSAENWEGIGCEYRKYQNLSQGVGRRRYYRHKV